VVTTASYPARRFGIRSGMSVREARARCPTAIFLPVDPARYLSASEELIHLFERFTPLVEPASIDEVFLGLEGLTAEADGGLALARAIQSAVRREQRLGCSIGLGETKLMAKMATSLHKPDGLTRLTRGDFRREFWPRPTECLWGVGPESEGALRQLGIGRSASWRHARVPGSKACSASRLRSWFAWRSGRGEDRSFQYFEGLPVRSMGHESTFPVDLVDGKRWNVTCFFSPTRCRDGCAARGDRGIA
jgi:DNA polymerase-4